MHGMSQEELQLLRSAAPQARWTGWPGAHSLPWSWSYANGSSLHVGLQVSMVFSINSSIGIR